MSDLICSLARTEDCIIMGRCADAILRNNHIPHVSLFISAPFGVRVQHIMAVRNMGLRQAARFLKKWTDSTEDIMNFIQAKNGASRKIMISASTAPIMASRKLSM